MAEPLARRSLERMRGLRLPGFEPAESAVLQEFRAALSAFHQLESFPQDRIETGKPEAEVLAWPEGHLRVPIGQQTEWLIAVPGLPATVTETVWANVAIDDDAEVLRRLWNGSEIRELIFADKPSRTPVCVSYEEDGYKVRRWMG